MKHNSHRIFNTFEPNAAIRSVRYLALTQQHHFLHSIDARLHQEFFFFFFFLFVVVYIYRESKLMVDNAATYAWRASRADEATCF